MLASIFWVLNHTIYQVLDNKPQGFAKEMKRENNYDGIKRQKCVEGCH